MFAGLPPVGAGTHTVPCQLPPAGAFWYEEDEWR